jgi:hypothetical protein
MSMVLAIKPDTGRGLSDIMPLSAIRSGYRKSKHKDITLEEYMSNIMSVDLLSRMGVTLMHPDEYEKKHSFKARKRRGGKFGKRKHNISDVLGRESAMATDGEEDEDNAFKDTKLQEFLEKQDLSPVADALRSEFALSQGDLFSQDRKVTSITDVSSDSPVLERFLQRAKKKTSEQVFSSLPPQIASLFVDNTRAVKNDWHRIYRETGLDIFNDPKSFGLVYFNYHMINRIEVFAGYKKSRITRQSSVSDPKFVLLTSEIIKRSVEKNKTLLCRMRPYSESIFGFGHKERMSLPIFDEYFLLSPRKAKNDELASSPPGNKFTDRILHRGKLNEAGLEALESIVQTAMLEDMVMPWALTTGVVQQPLGPTKIGTHFGESRRRGETVVGKDSASMLDSLSSGPEKRRTRKRKRRRPSTKGGSSY